ncbi:hypothetical protein ESB04_09680, partial [Aquirufa rosea]
MKNKCSHYAYLFVLSVLVSLAASRNSMAANRPADVGFNVSLESSSYNSATNKSTFLYKITQKESQLTGLSHFIIQNFCLPTGETNIKGENSPNGSSEWETISADKMNTSDGSTTECQDGFGSLLKFNYNGGGRTNYYRLTIKGHFIPTDGQSILRWGGTSGTVTCAKVAVQVPTPVVNKQTVYVCQNSSTTLSARTGSNYKWTLNGSSLTDVSSSISASTGGEYQVIYDASNCRSIELFTLQVRDLPTLSVTNTSICPSANGTLTASGASSYSWSNAATSASITVSPSSTTTYTVTGTDANGCQNTASGTVTVYKLPTISVNSPSICIGGSSNLTASGATTYAWSNSQSGSTINVSPTTTSSYTVTGTDANGCSNTASATVTVHLLPTVTATQNQTVCAGAKVTLSGSGASSYAWNNGITNGTEFTA